MTRGRVSAIVYRSPGTTLGSVSNILPLYSPSILTRSRVNRIASHTFAARRRRTCPYNEIPWNAFNYGVKCQQIDITLHSALILTDTARSEGQFAPDEGCLCIPGASIIVLHLFLAKYLKPSIVYIFSFPVEIPLLQNSNNRSANNDVYSILWHQLRVLFPLPAVGRPVGWLNSWDNMRTTQCAQRCMGYEWLKW